MAYYKLDYLGSSGTQYIDTNFKPNQDTRILVSIKTTSLNSYPMGCRTSAGSKAFCISTNYNGNTGECFFNYNSGYSHFSQVFSTSEFVEIDFNKNQLYKNGVLAGSRTYGSFQCDFNAYLFGANDNGTFQGNPCQIKWAKIYDNGTLIRDLIPAERRSDNVLGMYDKLNKVFYTNAGSGTFTAGDRLLSGCYIKVNGEWKDGTAYVKVNGTWKEGSTCIKVNGQWKEG